MKSSSRARTARGTAPERVHPHTLRHNCATHLLQNGMDVRQVQRFLGYANLETTTIYLHIVQSDMEDMTGRMDERLP